MAISRVPRLGEILAKLESFYGTQSPRWPIDPFEFLVWWHCGYPPSEERCARGWSALTAASAVRPGELLARRTATLARALEPGGMLPESRAAHLREIARRVRAEFAGNLAAALARMPEAAARKTLRSFHGIGVPGAERILLFAGLAPIAAVPSNCPYVAVRISSGREPARYDAVYARAQQWLDSELPGTSAARQRAYLLLQRHGQQICRPAKPQCGKCPVASQCVYARKRARPPVQRRQ
ncbi:MAG TPA: hypothetical protein VET46_09235 [Steroidobacteraceae bacterium]|nr:hypothetical protein [Steroidobacteraceae bacterium]